jgi:hypothetical protein
MMPDIKLQTQFARQSGLLSTERLNTKLNIIGAGAIGSFSALTLSKMGFTDISVYDADTVELHNLPNQFYRESDIGKPKVVALKEIIQAFTGTEIKAYQEMYKSQSISGITIVGVDSMDVRIGIWKKLKLNIRVPLLLDARMGGEVMMLIAINPTDIADIKRYEASLYTSKEAVKLRCTQQAIIYTLLHISGYIANTVKRFVMNEAFQKEIIFDTNTHTLMIDMPEMREEVA